MSCADYDRDDFWDIDKLVPKKKPTMRPFVTKPVLSDYTVHGDTQGGDPSERRLTVERGPEAISIEEHSYEPTTRGLIKRVTIRKFSDRYDFYGNFRKAALVYYDYKTEKCDFAPYYSYMPQYSQLTSAQKNYYFYWRDMVRRGKFIRSDYSYVYLYAYEILNLPDKISPEEGIDLLCRLWREYRAALPRIDSYFTVWVQDYCMVYGLSCPMDAVRDFIFDVIEASDFKEFYLSDVNALGVDGTETLVAYLSYYDWRRGRFAGGENAARYREHMQGAMRSVVRELYFAGRITEGAAATIKRDAFAHSLCTHAVKCKLEIEYTRLSGDEQLRLLVTAAVRYTENKLRALFGIKSRLAIKDLPDEYRRLIDRYFDGIFATEAAKRARAEMPEYEKLYDAPREKLSFSGADEIERASWSTTARLVTEEELAEEQTEAPTPEICEPMADERDTYGLSSEELSALSALFRGECAITDDALAERINEAFSDGFGDVILECADEGYSIIEDYREEIGEWLRSLTK